MNRLSTVRTVLCSCTVLLLLAACGGGSPEEQVARLRGMYSARLNGFLVQAQPAPEPEIYTEEGDEPMAPEAEMEEGEGEGEMVEPMEVEPANPDIMLDILIQHDSPEILAGITVDVSMADAQNGWGVGQLGLILRTEDGGETWTQQANSKQAQGVQIFAVQAVDANRAWAIGEWGTRILTEDGGRTWQDFSLTIDDTHPQFVWLTPPEQEKVRSGDKVFEDVGLNDIYCLPADRQLC